MRKTKPKLREWFMNHYPSNAPMGLSLYYVYESAGCAAACLLPEQGKTIHVREVRAPRRERRSR